MKGIPPQFVCVTVMLVLVAMATRTGDENDERAAVGEEKRNCRIEGPEASKVVANLEMEYINDQAFVHQCNLELAKKTGKLDKLFASAFKASGGKPCKCAYENHGSDYDLAWTLKPTLACEPASCWQDYKDMYDRKVMYEHGKKIRGIDNWQGKMADCEEPCPAFSLHDEPWRGLKRILKLKPKPIPTLPEAVDARKAVIKQELDELGVEERVSGDGGKGDVVDDGAEDDLGDLEDELDTKLKTRISDLPAVQEIPDEEIAEDELPWASLLEACGVGEDFAEGEVCDKYGACREALDAYEGINSESNLLDRLRNALEECDRVETDKQKQKHEDMVVQVESGMADVLAACGVQAENAFKGGCAADSCHLMCSEHEACEEKVMSFSVGDCRDPRCDVVSIQLQALHRGVDRCLSQLNIDVQLATVQAFCQISNQDLAEISEFKQRKLGVRAWLTQQVNAKLGGSEVLTKICERKCQIAIKTTRSAMGVVSCSDDDEDCKASFGEKFHKIVSLWAFMMNECPQAPQPFAVTH